MGEGCWGAPLRSNDDDKTWTRASGSFNQFKWMFVSPEGIEVRTVKTDQVDQVVALCDEDRFTIPKGIDLWKPSTGEVIHINDTTNNVLAVNTKKMKIEDFEVKAQAKGFHVSWVTYNEKADIVYDLQRENKDGTFKSVAKIPGKGGSANHNYTFMDKTPSNVRTVYRLKTFPKEATKKLNSKLD